MKRKILALKKGFTLLELTLAIAVGMTVGSIVLALLNQQVAFLRIFQAQSFLSEEAPIINNHISRLLLNADRFRLHASMDDARLGANPQLIDSPVVVLNFTQPDGSVRAGILSFEVTRDAADNVTDQALNYYVVAEDGTIGDPQWVVTDKPTDVAFFVTAGIIRVRLTGPAGEEIVFSGSM